MIRLDLLRAGTSRKQPAPSWHTSISPIVVWVVIATTLTATGWQYRALKTEALTLERHLDAAREEAARTAAVSQERQDLDARRRTIAEHLAAFDRARQDQHLSVRLLFDVAGSLPDGVSLAELQRTDTEVSIEGRGATHAAVAEFLARLDASGLFPRPVELDRSEVQSTSDPVSGPAPIHFAIHASLTADIAAPSGAGDPVLPRASATRPQKEPTRKEGSGP